MLTIVVEHCTQTVVKEVHIETIVLLEGFLPRDVGVVLRTLVGTLRGSTVLDSEEVGKAWLVHAGIGKAVESGSLVHDIGV